MSTSYVPSVSEYGGDLKMKSGGCWSFQTPFSGQIVVIEL